MIQQGNTVKVHYTGMLENNEVFDSSEGKDPIEFKIGGHQVIEGFESAVIGLKKGDKVKVKITPDKGYGELREDLIVTVPRDQVPQDAEIGSQLQGVGQNGEPFNVTVTSITNESVVLDANHPLSGKDIFFEIQVVDFV